jgi:hypothetical protein
MSGRVNSEHYSESALDTDDIFIDISGSYNQERNVYALAGGYDIASNLDFDSNDFAIVSQRVQRKERTIGPQYQRSINERLVLSLSYNLTNVDYKEAAGTAFVSYESDTLSGSMTYSLTDSDALSLQLQGTDYESNNGNFEFKLFVTQLSLQHEISELWTSRFSAGVSTRKSSNNITQAIDFFGQTVTFLQVIDDKTDGLVYDAVFTRRLEDGAINISASLNNSTNSFGGLNEVERLQFEINNKISELWNMRFNTVYNTIESVTTASSAIDRRQLSAAIKATYSFDQSWTMAMSYRHVQQKFNNNTINSSESDSNILYFDINYKFSELSTY